MKAHEEMPIPLFSCTQWYRLFSSHTHGTAYKRIKRVSEPYIAPFWHSEYYTRYSQAHEVFEAKCDLAGCPRMAEKEKDDGLYVYEFRPMYITQTPVVINDDLISGVQFCRWQHDPDMPTFRFR